MPVILFFILILIIIYYHKHDKVDDFLRQYFITKRIGFTQEHEQD